jgi:single-stranded DNA-binding protein
VEKTGFNRLILLGKLSSQPELRYGSDNQPTCSAELSCSEIKPNGLTESLRIPLWLEGELSENFHQTTQRGSWILVEGRLFSKKNSDIASRDREQLTLAVHHFVSIDNKRKKDTSWSEAAAETGATNPWGGQLGTDLQPPSDSDVEG